MDENTLQSIKDALAKNDQVGIVVGRNPSLDTMAAALSLYLFLKQTNKNVTIASPTEPIVEISSLVGIDKVKTSLGGENGDLIVSFPYREGEIEKVSYTLEEGYLNIVVKAGELGLSFNEKEVKYKRAGHLPTLLFVVGTPRLSDLGNLFDAQALKDTTVVNIDNKTENQGFGDIVFISPKFSSLCEIMTDFISVSNFSIDVDMAQNLLSGISFATNNFQDQKTSYLAFETAAMLMRKGAARPKNTQAVSASPQQDRSFFRPRPVNQQQDEYRSADRNSFMSQQQQQQKQAQNQNRGQFPKKQSSEAGSRSAGQPQQPKDQKDQEEVPSDWLTPKVYKGSNLG